jgi:serine/threonine-protein kinase ULK/ATG1
VKGLKYLYDKKIIHRDLKLENLLIHFTGLSSAGPVPWGSIDLEFEEFVVKIADFGFAKNMEPDGLADRKCGTPLVMAPEVIQNKPYSHKRDVWALGALYYQLVTGNYVFGHEYITIPDLEDNV